MKDAPNIAEDGRLSPQEEQQLYRYYGIGYGQDPVDGRAPRPGLRRRRRPRGDELGMGHRERGDRDGDGVYDDVQGRGVVGRDTSGPTTDDAMTRSEEQLRVGTETARRVAPACASG